MPIMQLTLGGALASLRSEYEGQERLETGAGRVKAVAPFMRWLAWVVTASVAVVVGLTGCATLSADSSPEQKQKVVAEKAQARWDALVKGDVDAAYQFLSVGSKTETPLATYKAKIKPGLWRAAKVDKIDCEREICKVTVLVTYDYKMMKGIQTPVPETWIVENGSAGYIYR
jgi:hypothetical protein